MSIIKEGWDSYESVVLKPDAPRVQITETRRAFYAGAMHLFRSIMSGFSKEEKPTKSDFDMLDSIREEFVKFKDEVTKEQEDCSTCEGRGRLCVSCEKPSTHRGCTDIMGVAGHPHFNACRHCGGNGRRPR